MTISIQTPDTEVVWQRMVRQLQRAEGKAGAAFLFLPPQPYLTPPLLPPSSMQVHSCDTDQFCTSETAGVLQ